MLVYATYVVGKVLEMLVCALTLSHDILSLTELLQTESMLEPAPMERLEQ